ncbi:DUF4097 domain-containing protein [Ruminococcaceae bacterium OttesenSCG-928-I18]|nr:DUF4097 domain-containing protein [Ruminococcaceae bacterium OttesenSCG-928-I18]
MGKKIVFAVFGGIALLGLLMSIVGWVLGGRPGTLRVSEGEVLYQADGESVAVAKATGWGHMRNALPWHWIDRELASEEAEQWEGHEEETHEAYPEYEDSQWLVSGEEIQIDAEKQQVPLSFDLSELKQVQVDIDAGYLVIKQGEELGFTVQGPMEYTSEFQNGVWMIHSSTDLDGANTKPDGNATRFYNNGQDVTTVFTIYLPKNAAGLEAQLDLGVMTVKDLEVDWLDLSLDFGSAQVKDVKAARADFTVDLGGMEVRDVEADDCSLNVDLGSVELTGVVHHSLNTNCELGAIVVKMPRPANGYNCTTEVNLGNIEVDGISTNVMGSGTFSEGDHPDLQINVHCDLGSVEVQFE